MIHNLMLFFIFALFANISFAAVDDKVGNVNYLKILQDKESSKNQDYGFEVEGAGLYLAPTITTLSGDDIGDVAKVENFQDSLKNGQKTDLNYQLNSNIGINFNKYFTGFLAYDLGAFGINSETKNINLNIDSSTIKLNGFGSKVNFSDDFYLKLIYFENDIDQSEQNNLDIDKDRQFQLNGVINF